MKHVFRKQMATVCALKKTKGYQPSLRVLKMNYAINQRSNSGAGVGRPGCY